MGGVGIIVSYFENKNLRSHREFQKSPVTVANEIVCGDCFKCMYTFTVSSAVT